MSASITAQEPAQESAQDKFYWGGFDKPVQAYLNVERQTVTSHGHESVSDREQKIKVEHSPGVTWLTPLDWDARADLTKKGRVHVPIHNPPGFTVDFRPRPPRIGGFNPAVDNLPVDYKPAVDESSLPGGIGVFNPLPRGIDGFWALEAIDLNFDSVHYGTVVKVSLYYDGYLVVSKKPPVKFDTKFNPTNINKPRPDDQDQLVEIQFTTAEAREYGYVPPKGISVTLDLEFPEERSAIKLYSVTLVYKALPQWNRSENTNRVCITYLLCIRSRKSPSMYAYPISRM